MTPTRPLREVALAVVAARARAVARMPADTTL